MIPQNCVPHTAISKSTEKYKVKILRDYCITVNETIHHIALEALIKQIELVDSKDILE